MPKITKSSIEPKNVQEKVEQVEQQQQEMEVQENSNVQQQEGFVAVPMNPRKLEENEEKQLWKLFKGKTVLMFRLCGSCQHKLYHSTEKWSKFNNGIDVKIHLCPRCVRVNCWMTNLMAPATPKKFVQKLENEKLEEK